MMGKIAGELYGRTGDGGMDTVALQHMLLQFGKFSHIIREVVVNLFDWLSNSTRQQHRYQEKTGYKEDV